MTTPRPTGAEPPVPPYSADTVAAPASSLLPDEATLNRLAAEFFSALPSAARGIEFPGITSPDIVTPDFASPGIATLGVAEQGMTPSSASVPAAPPAAGRSAAGPAAGGTSAASPWMASPSAADRQASMPPSSPAQGVPPGGPTPDPTVPSWQTEVPANPAGRPPTAALTGADVYTDQFLPDLPTLSNSPRLPPSTGPAPSAEPSFYFLDRPEIAAPQANSQFYFLDEGRRASPDRHPPFDVYAVRNDFPILRERVNGQPLVWFDNAATTQKPRSVIERLTYFYEHENSNIHRAAHELAARATDAYEQARDIVARFLGASSAEEIIFVRGATEGINLVAQTWGRKNIREGDEIVISHLEHHANIVPWQMLAGETGAVLKVIPVDDSGQLLLDEYTRLLSDRTKLVSVAHVSNALGTITPVHDIVAAAHRAGAVTLVDGAQSVPHTRIDVRSIGADFFVFSGHKLFGPTGIGVVYGTSSVLQDVPPWQGGGNMISDVTLERSLFQPPPGRFEAGTGNIADAVGLGMAIEYVEGIGIDNIARYEHDLLAYATPLVAAVPGVRLVGTAVEKASVLSFVMDGYQPLEVGKALNENGIAVRAGHHCAQPILRRFGLEATVRPSFTFYNTCEEVDRMVAVLERLARARR
ncbi:family 2A encapsulin nanocompartment cargo protein cysteine desulfurase [Nocardia sp. NBC_00403]|uniref:family 2A encapsulin nanocompartment cargo protein cysteine desulfurase n=1 Tax=Nocardia sp. NBC_00403 TaxID=2975990 RepID=UPI002E21A6D5